MSDQQRQYVGSGKKVGNYDLVNIALCVSDIPKEKIYEYKGKKYLNLTLGGKKGGADQYGRTHGLWINDFKPDAKKEAPTQGAGSPDDIPF